MRILRRLAPIAFCLAGMATAHGPVLSSRLALIQNDLGDSRFVNYLFEHSWRWLLRKPHHLSFWDPEFFYPARNVGAYAESLLGSAPIYWLFRAFSVAPDTSFQLWLFVVSALNFAAAYWLLRRPMKYGVLASCAGAFLFAFAASRVNQTMHHQLFPHFFTPIAIGALIHGLESPAGRQGAIAVWVFAAACALQLYASVYLGWYLALGLLLAALAAVAFKRWRDPLLALAKAQWRMIVAAGSTAALSLSWMAVHYARASSETGGAAWSEVVTMLPRAQSWIHVGPYNWLYGWTSSWSVYSGMSMEHEQRLGIGLATTAMVLLGLAIRRRGQRLSMMALLLGVAVLVSSIYAADVSPWRAVYAAVPGAQAIRAVCRIAIALLLPASVGLAAFITWLVERGWVLAALPLSVLVAAEQGETTPTYDKAKNREDIAALASQIDPARCQAFFFAPVLGQKLYWKYQVDAMWASLETDVPTINGYSRTGPPGWGLNEPNMTYEAEEEAVTKALGNWEQARGLDPATICFIKVLVRDGPNQAEFVSQRAPTQMVAKQGYDVEVVMRNNGFSTWSEPGLFRLGGEAPLDCKTWSSSARVQLTHPVPPGQEATFDFHVTAPEKPDRYPFRWRMVQDNVTWFGAFTPMVWVDVSAPAPDAGTAVSSSTP